MPRQSYFKLNLDLTYGYVGYVWLGPAVLVVAFLHLAQPDVDGRSLDDLDALFEAKVPARRFPKYTLTDAGVVLESKADLVDTAKAMPEAEHAETVA